MDNNQIDDP